MKLLYRLYGKNWDGLLDYALATPILSNNLRLLRNYQIFKSEILPKRKRLSSNLRTHWRKAIVRACRICTWKVDYLFLSPRYCAIKICVFSRLHFENNGFCNRLNSKDVKPLKLWSSVMLTIGLNCWLG